MKSTRKTNHCARTHTVGKVGKKVGGGIKGFYWREGDRIRKFGGEKGRAKRALSELHSRSGKARTCGVARAIEIQAAKGDTWALGQGIDGTCTDKRLWGESRGWRVKNVLTTVREAVWGGKRPAE